MTAFIQVVYEDIVLDALNARGLRLKNILQFQ